MTMTKAEILNELREIEDSLTLNVKIADEQRFHPEATRKQRNFWRGNYTANYLARAKVSKLVSGILEVPYRNAKNMPDILTYTNTGISRPEW